jgi:hypothetical protein
MDGFKNSTRVQYMKGGSCEGYAKGGAVKGAAKIAKVMGEFKAGTLHSGSKKGPEVTSKKQATAIALSEARKAGAKIPMKKGLGGSVEADDVMMARMSKDEMSMGAKGVKMAQERMARDKTKGMGQISDREMQLLRREAVKPVGKGALAGALAGAAASGVGAARAAKKLPPKAVPVAAREPLISPSTMRDLKLRGMREAGGAGGLGAVSDSEMRMLRNAAGYKKGGLSAMPKNKGGKC